MHYIPTSGHPDFDQWVEYRDGLLTSEAEEALQDHLVDCSRCTSLLLDLEDFLTSPDEEPKNLDFERSAVWRGIRPRPSTKRWHYPTSLAAAFLVGMLGFGLWTSGDRQDLRHLEQVVAQLAAPQPNAPIYHLAPTSTRSSRSTQQGFSLPGELQTFTLVFNLVTDHPDATFRTDILDSAGVLALSVPDLELDELGTITLGLSRKSLKPGDYIAHLYTTPSDDGSNEDPEAPQDPEASYQFRLEAL